MKPQARQLENTTQDMDRLLHEGRMEDFLRLLDQRQALLRAVAGDPLRSPENNALLRDLREQTERWLAYVRQTSSTLQQKINRANQKRSALAHMAGAYAGANHAGAIVFRRG